MLRVETSFQDTPGDGFYFVLSYRGRPLVEQLSELDLKNGDKVVLWEEDCEGREVTATLLVDYKHCMMFERRLWAREEQDGLSEENRLQPHEYKLTGNWIREIARIRGDTTCERVEWLTRTYLVPLAYKRAGGGWETLYRDPGDDRLWERTFPRGEMQGGGPPQLMHLTPHQAYEKYDAVVVRKS